MKLSKIGLLAGAAVAMAAASSANATVYIAYKYGAGPLTLVATDPTDASWSAALAPNLKVTTTTGSTGGFPSVLDSNVSVKYTSMKNAAAPKLLDIFVTVTNLTSFLGKFDSGLTENQLTGNWKITESTFYSASNALYGGTLLASNLFNGPNKLTANFDALSNNIGLTSPFSVTHQYHVVAPTSGATNSALSTISVTAQAVPEPATWAMMLAGFGLVGLALRARAAKAKDSYAA